jgi:hypothetical protein
MSSATGPAMPGGVRPVRVADAIASAKDGRWAESAAGHAP